MKTAGNIELKVLPYEGQVQNVKATNLAELDDQMIAEIEAHEERERKEYRAHPKVAARRQPRLERP